MQVHDVNSDAAATPTSLQIARRLLAREAAPGKGREPKIDVATLQRTVASVSESLRDAMGEDGSTALLARALARTEAAHPALKKMRRLNEGSIQLDVVASIEAHNVATATAAVEALLAALIDILSRLIGEEMAIRLVESDPVPSRRRAGAQEP
ncbi:MAG TPA: hypothetical protein VIF32_13940 [Gemmatimonadaceae bacterium]